MEEYNFKDEYSCPMQDCDGRLYREVNHYGNGSSVQAIETPNFRCIKCGLILHEDKVKELR